MSFDTHLHVGDIVAFLTGGALVDGTVLEVIGDDLHDIDTYAVDAAGNTYLVYADEVQVLAHAA